MSDGQSYFRKLRILTILMIASLVITTLVVIVLYPENTGRNGIISWVITIILLLFYLFFCYYLPFFGSRSPFSDAIRNGTSLGLVAAVVWIVQTTIIHSIPLPGILKTIVTLGFMFLVLLIFGYTSYRMMSRSNHFFASLLSTVWSSMFSILVLFVYSWIMTFLFMPWIEKILIGDPDYLISGMINISDYTIHHNIESAGIHLLEAPVLALIVGFIGIFVFRIRRKVVHS